MASKADLHVHSKHSNKPTDFYIKLLGSAESYTEPLDVYKRAKAAGMDFVTLSDHDCINGALEIAHLPGTFISTEVTTTFPEDGCRLHCLVTGITETQFAEIDRLRENIYDFRQYLADEDIIYSVAHPLYQVNDQMTVDHVEKLLLLFDRFEAINGARHPRAAEMVHAIWTTLTPEHITEMENRQGMQAWSETPWKKIFTAGSDDHGGSFIASAWTETPYAATVDEFLNHLRNGDHVAAGEHGSSLQLAHSFVAIARESYRERFRSNDSTRDDMMDWLFRRLLGEDTNRDYDWLTKAKLLITPVLQMSSKRAFEALETRLINRMAERIDEEPESNTSGVWDGPHPDNAVLNSREAREQQTFATARRVNRRISSLFLTDLAKSVSGGQFLECLQSLPLAAATAIAHWPYLASFKTQHKDERFLQAVADHFPAARHMKHRSNKKLWVSDTVADVNGVARTVQAVAAVARKRGEHLTLATCLPKTPNLDVRVKNFVPVSRCPLPEYPEIVLSVPCLLELMEYMEREEFSEVIISTPGPLGLAARMAGQWLGLKVSGIYHTDFPRYVRLLTGHVNLENWTWQYMRWFFGPLETVYVPSQFYMRALTENGFNSSKLKHMPRGIEMDRFSPEHRQADFFEKFGLGNGFQFLYVGRISREKNVRRLLEAFSVLAEEDPNVQLAIVGDGPGREVLESEFAHPRIAFTGYLHGEELSAAYASANAFVFPSTTDTFGNVILEAHASGLPAIVSDKGGPSEIVSDGRSGYVVSVEQTEPLAQAMKKLAADPKMARMMGDYAREQVSRRSWDAIFDILWNTTPAKTVPGSRSNDVVTP